MGFLKTVGKFFTEAVKPAEEDEGRGTGKSRVRRGHVEVWDGNRYVQLPQRVLSTDGYVFKGKVVHQLKLNESDKRRSHLVLVTPEQHRAIHLVEDGYDIVKSQDAKPSRRDHKIYVKLDDMFKRREVKNK